MPAFSANTGGIPTFEDVNAIQKFIYIKGMDPTEHWLVDQDLLKADPRQPASPWQTFC